MKRIAKRRPPAELSRWLRKQQRQGLNRSYGDMPGDVKQALLDKLLKEQGGLCGYTGIRITSDSSHIEHIYPQTKCREEEGRPELYGAQRDVDYYNVIAAFPKSDSDHRDRFPFGAKTRLDWYDERLFVHPLRLDCEEQFRFTLRGVIEPADGDEEGPAGTTIKKLNLDDRRRDENGRIVADGPLTELRRKAIDTLLFDEDAPLSRAQIETIRANIYHRDGNGQFTEFCFVLKQACDTLLRKADQERARREAIRRQERHR